MINLNENPGYSSNVRTEDGKIAVSLRKRWKTFGEIQQMLLEHLIQYL